MRKLIFCLLLVGALITQSTKSPVHRSTSVVKLEDDSVPVSLVIDKNAVRADTGAYLFSDEIPLDHNEQRLLQDACKEFNVPYAMALALIEKETNFRNVKGDSGASHGYMQIQPRWNKQRMKDLGATDLMNPEDNFRVGLDILSENYRKYDSWGTALTVYNMGHNPNYISKYAYDVLAKYEKWTDVIDSLSEDIQDTTKGVGIYEHIS